MKSLIYLIGAAQAQTACAGTLKPKPAMDSKIIVPFDGPKKAMGSVDAYFTNSNEAECYVSNCYLENM